MLPIKNNTDLVAELNKEDYLFKIIQQLNKDFYLANVDVEFPENITAEQLHLNLATVLKDLILNNYDDYLNLLYRIDVSEKSLIEIKNQNLDESMNELSFYLLKREFQKVWLKRNYKN